MFGRHAIVLANADRAVGDTQGRDRKFGDAGYMTRAVALGNFGHLPGLAYQLLELLGGGHGRKQQLRAALGCC